MRSTLIKTLVVACLALLAGCGFQLRGQNVLPFKAVYVNAAPHSTLAATLEKQLEIRDKLATTRKQADLIVTLADETQSKSILTLSTAGKVQEYRLTHSVTVSANDATGNELLAPTDTIETRDFTYNPGQILASEAFEATLNNDMDRAAANQILRRLSFIRKQ